MKFIFRLFLMAQFLMAQMALEGTPYTKSHEINNTVDKIILDEIPLEKLLIEDENREPGTPFRYGFIHETDFNVYNSGKWTELDDGSKIWQIYFQSSGAYSMSIEYENFFIPEGGELYIYDPSYKAIHGAYTSLNNSEDGFFSTPHVEGDEIMIEYYQSKEVIGKLNLQISEIIHDYIDIINYSNNNRDWECGVNVICETEEYYQGPINSVAFLDMGGFICSGAMVNNVRQDLTPYFLTAWHCTDGENPSTFRFYFNKMASSCENTWGSLGSYAFGSDLVADSDGIPGGDWALLLIDDQIEEEWEVFYAGWDVTENYPRISCGVHHPGGSPKRINYDDDIVYGAWWDNPSDGLTHWQVNWDEGGSEGGSSGSPIFNERSQIVGVLTGGSGGCGEGWPDLYGKLYYGWNWELSSNERLIDWLDPDYTGNLVLDGTYIELTTLTGDLNFDDSVNILDIILLANLILADNVTNDELQMADLNEDSLLNILDIIVLANIIISSSL